MTVLMSFVPLTSEVANPGLGGPWPWSSYFLPTGLLWANFLSLCSFFWASLHTVFSWATWLIFLKKFLRICFHVCMTKQKPLFLLIQLQHLFLLGMVKAFIAYTWSSLNPVSSVVILSKKQCLSHILKWTKSVSIPVTASRLNSDLGWTIPFLCFR